MSDTIKESLERLNQMMKEYDDKAWNSALDAVFERWVQGKYSGLPTVHEGNCPSGGCPACDEFSYFLQELRKNG